MHCTSLARSLALARRGAVAHGAGAGGAMDDTGVAEAAEDAEDGPNDMVLVMKIVKALRGGGAGANVAASANDDER